MQSSGAALPQGRHRHREIGSRSTSRLSPGRALESPAALAEGAESRLAAVGGRGSSPAPQSNPSSSVWADYLFDIFYDVCQEGANNFVSGGREGSVPSKQSRSKCRTGPCTAIEPTVRAIAPLAMRTAAAQGHIGPGAILPPSAVGNVFRCLGSRRPRKQASESSVSKRFSLQALRRASRIRP